MTLGNILLAQGPKSRRAIALGLVPVIAMLAWAVLVWPLMFAWDSQQEWRDSSMQSLARDRAAKASEGVVRQGLQSLATSPIAGKFYSKAQEGAGANAFQSDVRSLLGSVGAMAQTASPIAATEQGSLSVLGLHVTTSMTVDQFKNFLARLESHSRYIRIEQLDVTSPSVQAHDQNPLLTVAMDLAAFQSAPTNPMTRVASSTLNGGPAR
jgi:hypothetical protein